MENVVALEIVNDSYLSSRTDLLSNKQKELKSVCSEMIRKDFELMVLEHKLQPFFDGCQFYSEVGDDFSSIEQSIVIASGGQYKSVDNRLIDGLKENSTGVVFECFANKSLTLYEINVIAKKIASLIFKVIQYESVESALYEVESEFLSIHQFLQK